jgi:hypothetical protein
MPHVPSVPETVCTSIAEGDDAGCRPSRLVVAGWLLRRRIAGGLLGPQGREPG